MANETTFHCSVITPERAVLECEARSVIYPAHDGEMGILVNHAPLMCKLGIGTLRVDATNGAHVFYIDGGFAQVVDNNCTILTQQARAPKEIRKDQATKALEEARAMPVTDDASFEARQNAVLRAETQLKLAT